MTSKEALEKICLHCEHYHQDMCFRAIAGCEEWHKLEKDLEILAILKKYLKVKSLEIGIEDIVICCENENDFKEIKEWLNEK